MPTVKTANGTAYEITGPTTYTRTAGGVAKQHQCLAWGAVVPVRAPKVGEGAMLVVPIPHGLMPVRILVGKILSGFPIGFLVQDKDGALRVFVSGPVQEIDGAVETPEGQATELPDDLKKLLGGE